MSSVTWVQQIKTLNYIEPVATTTSVELVISEKYKNEQASLKINDTLDVSQESNIVGELYWPVKKNGLLCGYIKKEQGHKVSAFPCNMSVVDKKYIKGLYLIRLDISRV